MTTFSAARAARLLAGLALVAASAQLAACAKARAQTVADGPPLAMTAPPPRVLAPVEQPLEAAPAVPEVPAAPAPRAPAPPPPRRAAVANPPAEAEARPEPEPVTLSPAPPLDPGRELRAAPSTADAAAERQVRDLLMRAARSLARVDYRRLSSEARSQYEQSKRFSDQAEDALRDRNFPFAATLADKAFTLAAQLGG
jgi:actin cytoskeleton-regulatory complex protein PAN1